MQVSLFFLFFLFCCSSFHFSLSIFCVCILSFQFFPPSLSPSLLPSLHPFFPRYPNPCTAPLFPFPFLSLPPFRPVPSIPTPFPLSLSLTFLSPPVPFIFILFSVSPFLQSLALPFLSSPKLCVLKRVRPSANESVIGFHLFRRRCCQ